MTAPPALQLVDVSRRFGRVVALDRANLRVQPGTVHALLGENGAGKTTLVRIAYGMLQPDSGSILMNGAEVELPTPARAINAGIGMVHQHPMNIAAMTVAENISLGQRGRFRRAETSAAVVEASRAIGFPVEPNALAGVLPVAAQQRVEILKAVYRKARILFLDEPTAILAPTEASDLLSWLRRYVANGGTAVIITHKLEEALTYSDDITVLRNGRTVLTSPTRDTTTGAVATAMLGSASSVVPHGRAASVNRTEVVVRAAGLSLRRGNSTAAIRDATFELRKGSITGMAAVEGSGHQELLRALAGRLVPTSGVLVLPKTIGFVPEDRLRDAVALEFTLAENLAIQGAGKARGRIDWGHACLRTAGLLERFNVRASGPNEVMRSLSGGNQQKLVLGRELDSAPQLLVVENPTRGLDIRATAFIRQRILDARDSGTSVVFYSSDLDEVLDVADRMLVVHAGMVRETPADRVIVGAAMLGVA